MLSIRFFLDNILPAARKRNVLRWKRHFPLRKGKTFPTDKENPVFCKRGFPILREKRQSERVVDTEVEIQIPVVAAEGIADVGKTVQLFCEVRAAAEEHRQAVEQLRTSTVTLKESEEKWEEGMISVFELMEKRNLYILAKAELSRTRLQYELKSRTVDFYRTGSFLGTE